MVTYTKPQSDCNDYGHRAVGSGQGSGNGVGRMTDIIHCLKCEATYPEKQQIVTICPTCGNDDLSQTVYLQGEE